MLKLDPRSIETVASFLFIYFFLQNTPSSSSTYRTTMCRLFAIMTFYGRSKTGCSFKRKFLLLLLPMAELIFKEHTKQKRIDIEWGCVWMDSILCRSPVPDRPVPLTIELISCHQIYVFSGIHSVGWTTGFCSGKKKLKKWKLYIRLVAPAAILCGWLPLMKVLMEQLKILWWSYFGPVNCDIGCDFNCYAFVLLIFSECEWFQL